MISYFFEVSLCWAVFYLLFSLLLSNTTFFQYNRWYLLFSLVVGLFLPLVEFPTWENPEMTQFQETYLAPISIGVETFEQQVITITPENGTDYLNLVPAAIYSLGFLISTLLLLKGLWQIWQLFRASKREKKEGYTLVITRELHLPFSFFNYLFWSEKQADNPHDTEQILRHELAHIRGRHSFDVLVIELLCLFFWWNPLIYLYRHSMRNLHEFLADAAVLENTHCRQYGHLLLRQFQSGLTFALANNFIHSQLKKRIKMMTKTKSRQFMQLKYLLILPLFILLAMVFSSENGIANPLESETITQLLDADPFDKDKYISHLKSILKDYDKAAAPERENATVLKEYYQTVLKYTVDFPEHEKEILLIQQKILAGTLQLTTGDKPSIDELKQFASGDFSGLQTLKKPIDRSAHANQQVDEMPRFPGCENLPKDEINACSKRQLIEFMVGNLKYPEAAKNAKVEGTVLISFVVKADGSITDAIIKNDIGMGCGEAALAVVEAMPNWTPGKKGNKTVDVEMALPFTFKLPKEESYMEIFKVVEEMPRFPGCEEGEMTGQERSQCAQKKMLEFIYKNLRYPKAARERGAEGTVVIQFVVNKEGRLEQEKIVRAVDPDLDDEVLYIIELMNDMPEPWVPGKQRGKVVNVQYNLPIKFKLDGAIKQRSPESEIPEPPAQLELDDFKLLPNPTDGLVNISFRKSNEQVLSLKVLDNTGKLIYSREIKKETNFFSETIDLSEEAKGIYSLNINDGTHSLTKSIVLQ